MGKFKQKIFGHKHSIARSFNPLINSLDREFGEENVCIGDYHHIRNNKPGIRVCLKYFDPRSRMYRLQAKKGDLVQCFYLKLDEGYRSQVEDFLKSYPK